MLRATPLILSGLFLANIAGAREKWTELNIGPFYVDSDSDTAAARQDLTQLEQVRWVLGGLLESKDLPSLWPIRVLLTKDANANSNRFVLQQGQWLLVTEPNARIPLEQVARILLDTNTQRLPPEVESGLPALFGTLEARGVHVAWGGAPAHPDLNWSRMQLFATKFEYTLSFHILLAALRSGTDLRAAERNAFGKDPAALEQEVAANLAKGNWQATSVSGRPLDPKRDFGEHGLDDASAAVYLANAKSAPEAAEAAYRQAIEAGPPSAVLGYRGMAALAERNHENPKPWYDKAVKAGSHNAQDYVGAADGLDAAEALPLLKRAEKLNPVWAEPIFQEAQLAADKNEKLALLKKAAELEPRTTHYWVELAQFQTSLGQAAAAQGSWIRAEDSAATPAERDHLHQQRVDSEQERLDAAEIAARRERDAAHEDDERARQAQTDRIRAAEQRSNQGKDDAPVDAVPWSSVVPEKHLSGKILSVDCQGSDARLDIQDQQGNKLQLLLKDVKASGLACGIQKPVRSATLGYLAQPDERLHTAGQITSLKYR